MTNQIATYFNVAETFITDLTVEDGCVSFRMNDVWFSGKATKTGKLVMKYGFWKS
jgi:hypothetical protein